MDNTTPSVRSTAKSGFHRLVSPRLGGSPALHTPTTAATTVSENDDEAERRMRRLGNQMRYMMSPGCHTPRTATHSDQRPSSAETSSGSLSNAQMTEHYANCIKLSSENKINSRNAFGLHLIEHMLEILTLRGEMTNFQVASSTLDAGAKIYAGRVDSIYTDAYKMLGGLGREQPGKDADCPEGEGDGGPKKRGKQSSAQTIEKNLKSLDVNTFDLEFEVDPLFKRTSAAFDEGGVTGLLLNHLSIRDCKCELALNASEAPPAQDSDVDSVMVDLGPDRGLFSPAGLTSRQICPSFSSFLFSKDDTGKPWSLDDFLSSKQTASEHVDQYRPIPGGDASMLPGAAGDDDDYADFANQVDVTAAEGDPALDTTVLGVCADSKIAEFVPTDKVHRSLPQGGVVTVDTGKLLLSEAFEPSEYSYFNPSIVATWAGPYHWKLALGNKGKGDVADKGPKKKQTQARYRVDFLKDMDNSTENCFRKSKAATQLSIQALTKLDQLRTTLPRKTQVDVQVLHKLVCRPKWMIRRQRKFNDPQIGDPLEGQWYDYDNPNDNLNYCPAAEQHNGDSSSDVDIMPEQLEDETGGNFYNPSQGLFNMTDLPSQYSALAGDNLVPQPHKVQHIHIDYAKSAKRMDVKRLKSEIWKVLAVKPAQNVESSDKTWSDFGTVYSLLPAQLPSGMVKNLSVPMCFVCLLHLANEKGLEIQADTNLTTVSIDVPEHL